MLWTASSSIIRIPIHPPIICQSIRLSIDPSTHTSVQPTPTSLSACLSVCLSVWIQVIHSLHVQASPSDHQVRHTASFREFPSYSSSCKFLIAIRSPPYPGFQSSWDLLGVWFGGWMSHTCSVSESGQHPSPSGCRPYPHGSFSTQLCISGAEHAFPLNSSTLTETRLWCPAREREGGGGAAQVT